VRIDLRLDLREEETELLRLDIGTTFSFRLFLFDLCRWSLGVPLLVLLPPRPLSSDTSLSIKDEEGCRDDLCRNFFGVMRPKLDMVISYESNLCIFRWTCKRLSDVWPVNYLLNGFAVCALTCAYACS